MKKILYYCEQCNNPVYEKFGSGKYCSRTCSNKAGQKKFTFICPLCNRQFITTKSGFTYHTNNCSANLDKKQQKLELWLQEQHTCKKCGKIMTHYYGYGVYCSSSCAHARNHSDEVKRKISKSVIQNTIDKGIDTKNS